MKINGIFPIRKNSNNLTAVRFEGNEVNEFEKLFDNWTDVEFLFNFFEEHIEDLESGFYTDTSIDNAVNKTIEEAEDLEEIILGLSESGEYDDSQTLQSLFKPLDNRKSGLEVHQEEKASGSKRKSWLRIYAIRIAANTYVVSGGAIKLTETMNEREHLLKELDKLKVVKDFLIKKELFDEDDFDFLEMN
jgi:hypothetical protein